MFKKLSDFTYVRSGKEAIGFYLAYLLLVAIAGAVGAYIFGGLNSPGAGSFQVGINIGTIVAIVCCITITYLIFVQRRSGTTFSAFLFSLLAGFLAMLGGGLLGLILPAIVTTQGKKGEKEKIGKMVWDGYLKGSNLSF